MRAMVFTGRLPLLEAQDLSQPAPGPQEVLIRVEACGVCRTDLHIVDGELSASRLPLVPGHEIIGRIERTGPAVTGLSPGQRVGVPWLGHTCGYCPYCAMGRENLCDAPLFTGYTRDGGYAEYCVADAAYVFPFHDSGDPVALAPLLCAGLIGFRSYRMAGQPGRLGLYGFGAASHILCQIARHQGVEVFAFTRDGDTAAQDFARGLGAAWAGGSSDPAPALLDAAIIFAPVGALVPLALRAVRKGGRVVCGGIHMSDIPAFPYSDLWGERQVVSVANLTRDDGIAFMDRVGRDAVKVITTTFPLAQANEAIAAVRAGSIEGAAVLLP